MRIFTGHLPYKYAAGYAEYKTAENKSYRVGVSGDGISLFNHLNDTVNLISDGGVWGDVQINFRVDNENWVRLETDFTRRIQLDKNTYLYKDSLFGMPLSLKRIYQLKEDGLYLSFEIATTGNRQVELGDVMIPIQSRFTSSDDSGPAPIFEEGFITKHSISGSSSFLTFSKPSGSGPFYLMLPGKNTPLEFFSKSGTKDPYPYSANDTYKVYIHSACTGEETEGNWRLPHTSKVLAPAGEEGSKVVYEFKLVSVPGYEDLRDAVYENGLLDVRAAPGYTVPRDLPVTIALRLKGNIDAIIPEFPDETEIKPAGTAPNGYILYDVRFNKLGENILTVQYNNGAKSILEFFSTEPLETLIKKRSSFIVNHQQHKVPGKWWDGLYSIYDMKYGKLRGPEDTDGFNGWRAYIVACDDPVLGKPLYVAAKNAVFPDAEEIASLEYHLENFVWGKFQRTDKEEPYPYAVYGVPNWYVSRDSALHAMIFPGDKLEMQVWRAYDYPPVFKLYYHMYEIAKNTPQFTHYLNAEEYFERAVQTAIAYFKYPYKINEWFDTYKWGIYNEWLIPILVDELEQRGRKTDAGFLRGEWEKKAKYFIYDDKYPYRSEYAFDRTAFESSYALAKYAVENPMKPDDKLWYDKNKEIWYSHPKVTVEDARKFMDQQHYAGLAMRGWQAPKYYRAGADFSVSYMAMMGGWSVLEYGLYYSDNTDWIELGYNSYLSSWCLMNTGDEASGYGYWYPGKEKDGSTGWSFTSAKSGNTWPLKYEERGAWRYDGEIDLGYGATFHTARTIVMQDSVFGMHAYGGELKKDNSSFEVIPKDGVRQQFSYVMPDLRYHLSLDRDGFKRESPIIISSNGKWLKFTIENRFEEGAKVVHTTLLKMRAENVSPGNVTVSGKTVPLRKTPVGWEVNLPVSKTNEEITIQFK